MTIFKSLSPSDHSITPFPAQYQYSYTIQSGSLTNPIDVQLLYGSRFLTTSGDIRTADDEHELYDSVVQSFYSRMPYTQYGLTSQSYVPSESVWVITVSQDLYGNQIVPGTFVVTAAGTSSYDDTQGNLIVSESGIAYTIGRVFYDKGIALLQPTQSIVSGGFSGNGLCVVSGSSIAVDFTSTIKIYEHSIRVKLNPTDMMYSTNNPTATTSLYSASVFVGTALDLMYAKTVSPYITTVGLYNKNNELLVVGKVSVPIQRTLDSIQTFVVKFDT